MSYNNYIQPVELYAIMKDVVDSMRDTDSINGVVSNGSNFKYTANNSLSKNDYISITDNDGEHTNERILSADSTSFTISSEYTTAYRYKSNAPYFMHEKEAKAAEILTEKTGKGNKVSWQKYPLILLARPYTDDRTNKAIGYSVDFNIHIIINTEQQYRSDDRVNESFEPVLYPLYEEFLNKLPENRWIKEKYISKISHTKTDLMFISGNLFPDEMDGLTISFNDLEVLKNNQSCEQITTPGQYDLTLSTDGNGTIQPFEGTQTKNVNEIIAINATPNEDYTFLRWLINGMESAINPTWVKMTNNIMAIAEFIRYFTLNISSVGNGSTIPVAGSYEVEEGDTFKIEAFPDENNQFVNFDNNGTIITDNPYFPVVNSMKDIVANFSEMFIVIQNIFTKAPILNNDNWEYEDISGSDNNTQITNTQVANFTDSMYLDFGFKVQGGDSINFLIKIKIDTTVSGSILMCGASTNALAGFNIRHTSADIDLVIGNGTSRQFVTFDNVLNNGNVYYDISVSWSGISGETLTLTIDGVDYITNQTNGWIGDSGDNLIIGRYNMAGNIPLTALGTYFEFNGWYTNFQDSNGWNVLTSDPSIRGAIVLDNSTFWDYKDDTIEPSLLTQGVSKYLTFESNGISSILADPLNNNLDTERAVNGDFYTDANWDKTGDAEISNGQASFPTYADSITLDRLGCGTEANETYLTELNIVLISSSFISLNVEGSTSGVGHSTIGNKCQLIKGLDNSNRGIYIYSASAGSVINYISVKKVLSVSAIGNYSFKIKPIDSKVHIISTEINGGGNGYYLNITPTSISLYRNDDGAGFLIETQNITINDYSDISYVINDANIIVSVNGSQVISSNDVSYRSTKYITIDEKIGGEISHFVKDTVSYDTSNFSYVSGNTNITNAQGIGVVDFKGNDLEYTNSGYYNTDNKLTQPDNSELEAQFTKLRIPYPNLQYNDLLKVPYYIPETDGLNQLSLGDSTAASGFDVMIEAYNHYTRTRQSYSGRNTEDILTLLQADVVSDPTLISRQDRIFLLSGFNDYMGNKSVVEYTNAENNLLSYLRTENPTCEIIMGSVWNFIFSSYNPTGDADVENPSGLSYNKMRDIIEELTETYGICHARLEYANLIYPEDIPDGLHTSSSGTGNKKVSDYFIKRRDEFYGYKNNLITIDKGGEIINEMKVLKQ